MPLPVDMRGQLCSDKTGSSRAVTFQRAVQPHPGVGVGSSQVSEENACFVVGAELNDAADQGLLT